MKFILVLEHTYKKLFQQSDEKKCDPKNKIEKLSRVNVQSECQGMCNKEPRCNFFRYADGKGCILYKSCGEHQSASFPSETYVKLRNKVVTGYKLSSLLNRL